MKKNIVILLLLSNITLAQDAQLNFESVFNYQEYYVLKQKQNFIEAPFFNVKKEKEELDNVINKNNMNNLIEDIPGIGYQKTAPGHGSPFIRGFTSFRNIFLIDGIRLNNSVFREGPNQYWNTVDPYMVDSLELFHGPSSIIYGSDGVGGTLSVESKKVKKTWNENLIDYTYSTNDKSNLLRLETGGPLTKNIAFHLGASLKDIGEYTDGRGKLQENSNYDQKDYDFKIKYKDLITFASQKSELNDVWRTHKTIYGDNWLNTTRGTELMRKSDQTRTLNYIKITPKDTEIRIGHHKQEEVRDRIKKLNDSDQTGFDVDTFFFLANHEFKNTSFGDVLIGLDAYQDQVDSFTSKTKNGITTSSIQGPVGDNSKYTNLGLYIKDRFKIKNTINEIALRRSQIRAQVGQYEDPITKQSKSLDKTFSSADYSFKSTYLLNKNNSLYAGISSAFRAPNLSDLTRLDTAKSNEIETPSPDLEPENFLTYEIGFKHHNNKNKLDFNIYHVEIKNQITRTPTGNVIGGDNEVTKKNSGEGYVQGATFLIENKINSNFKQLFHATYQYGRMLEYPTSNAVAEETYISRMLPFNMRYALSYKKSKFDSRIDFVYFDRQDKLSLGNQRDTDRIPPGGNPSYFVSNIRFGYDWTNNLRTNLAINNIFDETYRVLGSGNNAMGRNFLLNLKYKF